MKTKTQKYLDTFFAEKVIPSKSWEIQVNDTCHLFTTEVVIEAIMGAPAGEQEQIADVLRRIDFHNGDVNDFLKHLSNALARGTE